MLQVQSAVGLVVLMGFAWAIGEGRRLGAWRIAAAGIVLQVAIAALLLKVPPVTAAIGAVNDLVDVLEAATKAGTSLVFGYLGGGALPFDEPYPGAAFVLAFRGLPVVLVVSALSFVLTYWGILPLVVRGFSIVLERSFRIGGAVGLVSAANVFIGMIEAPLFVRPYLARVTRSELFVMMVTGMATIAGTVFVLYASILSPVMPDAASQLLVASVISAPAAIAIAMLMVPPSGEPTGRHVAVPREASSTMDAVVQGTEQGVRILLSIVALLIVAIALVYLVNSAIGLLPDIGGRPLTLQRLFSWPLIPVAWLTGVPWSEAQAAAELLATKVVLNELVAYLDLAALPAGTLSDRSRLILVYAICGFANFGSLGILIGGLSVMVPERRDEIVGLGMKSILAGLLATCCTGCVVGLLTAPA